MRPALPCSFNKKQEVGYRHTLVLGAMADTPQPNPCITHTKHSDDDPLPRDAVIIVAFDDETTGGSMHEHALVEVGAAAMEASCDGKMRLLTSFEVIMKIPDDGRGWEPDCEKEFWDNPENGLQEKKKLIIACQTEPEDAMRAFINWVEKDVRDTYAGGDSKRVRFITDTVGYDQGWVDFYLATFAEHGPMHTFFGGKYAPLICTTSWFRGIAGTTLDDEYEAGKAGWYSATDDVRKALGIPDDVKSNTPHDHRAVHDAQNILETYLIVMRYVKARALLAQG